MSTFNMTDKSNLFKVKYGPVTMNLYNSANVLLGRVKKNYKFTGKRKDMSAVLSYGGGVGAGSLPSFSGGADYGLPQITSKKVYGVTEVDRESIYAAKDEGAFMDATKESVKKCVERYMRNMSRILHGDGTGALGFGDGATNVTGAGTAGDPYIVVIGSASWIEANWEENDYINYDAEVTLLEVAEVIPAADGLTGTLKLVGTSAGLAALVAGPGPVPTNKAFYMQNSKDAEPMGLGGILTAADGSTLYGVTVGRRWKAHKTDASGSTITPDYISEVVLEMDRKIGVAPKIALASYTQYRKLKDQQEDVKYMEIAARDAAVKARVGFKGMQIDHDKGSILVFPDPFVPRDQIRFVNDEQFEIHHRPGFGWFDDDGTVFLRVSGSDSYEARYGGYMQSFIIPTAQGYIDGLAG